METNEFKLVNDCLEISKLSNDAERRKLFANVISAAKLIQRREDIEMMREFINELN